MPKADELGAVLAAYKLVMEASWPGLHPEMTERSKRWLVATEAELAAELGGYLRQSSRTGSRVRVFWKLGPELRFGGGNDLFARDAGFAQPSELIGLDDYDSRLPWVAQAAKYRADDKEVVDSGRAKLDILERQKSSTGIIWVRAGKAPIQKLDGAILGVLGMYEITEEAPSRPRT